MFSRQSFLHSFEIGQTEFAVAVCQRLSTSGEHKIELTILSAGIIFLIQSTTALQPFLHEGVYSPPREKEDTNSTLAESSFSDNSSAWSS